jgi:hypothetical protein
MKVYDAEGRSTWSGTRLESITSRVETKTKVEGAVVSFRAWKHDRRVVLCAELVVFLYLAGMRVISAAKCGFGGGIRDNRPPRSVLA